MALHPITREALAKRAADLDPIDLVDPADVREIRRRLLAELAEELDQRTEAKRKRGLEATGARHLRQRFYDVADGLEEAAAAVRRHFADPELAAQRAKLGQP